ncbi:MAG: hypothetical protein B7733_12575 [Myxococcales bacterium FL481]|nr:MAG: hypothetical protein B7733_12575 [Myxococcales bacterium FL481]
MMPRMSDLMTGAQAMAMAFVDTQVRCAAAYPGSPATALAQALEGRTDCRFRWSTNENTAISHAFGQAMAGRGAVAVMKHVGINVARDAIEVMGVVHTLPAPFVVVEGADAKPGSSQSAQDNRPVWAGSPNAFVLAPSTVDECYALTRAACIISQHFGMMTVLRGEARMFESSGEAPQAVPLTFDPRYSTWPGRGYALATSPRTYAHHLETRRRVLAELSPYVEGLVEAFSGEREDVAVIVAGHLGAQSAEIVRKAGLAGIRLLTEHPLPEQAITSLCARFPRVAVLEECLPFLEDRVRALVQRAGVTCEVVGRAALGDVRAIGRIDAEAVAVMLRELGGGKDRPQAPVEGPRLAPNPNDWSSAQRYADDMAEFEASTPLSSFPASDPRRAMFECLRNLGGERATYVVTDPGITGLLALGGAQSDGKMHMGGAVPMAAGWSRARWADNGLGIAVVGDTNLPHSEWLGILESAAAGDDLMIVVADNGHSQATQNIVTLRPSPEQAQESLAALGVHVQAVRATGQRGDAWEDALVAAAGRRGVRLVWVRL